MCLLLTGFELLDGKLSCLTAAANGLVHSSIGSATNETNDFVPVDDTHFALVANRTAGASIKRI